MGSPAGDRGRWRRRSLERRGGLLLPGSNYLRISQPNQQAGLGSHVAYGFHCAVERTEPTRCEHDVRSATHWFQVTVSDVGPVMAGTGH
jgi:hypothetical protein